jgi:fatty acid-binding protein DegV
MGILNQDYCKSGGQMVNIITDSTADLRPDIVDEFRLTVVPLSITIGSKVYQEGVNILQMDLFDLVEEHAELPKTAAPSDG